MEVKKIKESIEKMNYINIYNYMINSYTKTQLFYYIKYNYNNIKEENKINLLIFFKLINLLENKSLDVQVNIIKKIFDNFYEKSKIYDDIDQRYNYYKKKVRFIIKFIEYNKLLKKYISYIKPLNKLFNIKKQIKYNKLSIEQKKEIRDKKKNRLIKKLGIQGYHQKCREYYKKWYNNLSKEKKKYLYLKKKYKKINSI